MYIIKTSVVMLFFVAYTVFTETRLELITVPKSFSCVPSLPPSATPPSAPPVPPIQAADNWLESSAVLRFVPVSHWPVACTIPDHVLPPVTHPFSGAGTGQGIPPRSSVR